MKSALFFTLTALTLFVANVEVVYGYIVEQATWYVGEARTDSSSNCYLRDEWNDADPDYLGDPLNT